MIYLESWKEPVCLMVALVLRRSREQTTDLQPERIARFENYTRWIGHSDTSTASYVRLP